MRRVLHIVRDAGGPRRPLLLAALGDRSTESVVLLIQEAVRETPSWAVPTHVAAADARERGLEPAPSMLEEDAILDLVYAADSVVVW